jgi:penicillin-binding protein 1C
VKPRHALAIAGVILLLAFLVFMAQAFFKAELVSDLPTPILEDRNGAFLSEGESEYARLGFWDMPDPVPERMRECVIAIEDKRFWLHGGVDARSVARALVYNATHDEQQGASTIAMQVARLQLKRPRTLLAKLDEMAVASWLVARHGREAVLRHYLKIAPQGNQVYGFAYAARRYFRKPVQDLSWAEAALLAALPQSPSSMSVFNYWGFQRALRRARVVLSELFRAEKLTKDEYEMTLRQLGAMNFQYRETRPDNTYHFIFRCLEEYGKERPAGLSKPLRTTLDLGLQQRLQALAQDAVRSYRALGAGNMAAIIADRKTGAVLAYVGSEEYFRDSQSASGSINYARTHRSSGSTVKPFLYALGLDSGRFTPGSILADLPFAVVGPQGEFSASNFDEQYLGPMLYRRALANSRNTPTLRVLEGVSLERAFDMYRQCGLADDSKPAGWYGYGLPIGGLYVTLEDLVAAYGILANDGMEFHLAWFQDDIPAAAPARQRQIFSEYAAREITLALSDPEARLPSFPRLSPMEFNFPVAVKTGTSQGYRDAWAVGYSRKYLVGVWMGHPQNLPMNRISGSFIASFLHGILSALQPDEERGLNVEAFPPPSGSVPVSICALSGKPANSDCPDVFLEYFREGTEPHDTCRVHIRFKVDKLSGEIATEATPARRVESRLFTVLGGEYAAWADRQGFGKPPVPLDASSLRAEISLVNPRAGARFLIDPDVPRAFQSIALRAEVEPFVPEVVWYVDGREYRRVPYPYETRWNLTEGTHSFQARFPNAHVESKVVSVQVMK